MATSELPSSLCANVGSVADGDAMDAGLRRCGRCGHSKPLGQFNWRRKALGQRDNLCRACRAEYKHEHYAANRARYIESTARRKRAVAAERTAYLIAYFATHPCVDCGERDPVVLEFDHIREKLFDIGANLRDLTWQSLLDEIAKCEVVCANCHRRRTARRRGSLRVLLTGEATS